MDSTYWEGLKEQIDQVFHSNPNLNDCRRQHPWVVGAHGDPQAGIWFVAESPSLSRIETVLNPDGGLPTPEAQWWASRGDQLFRKMLVKYGFKQGAIDSPGGWNCYITNVIKEADYTKNLQSKNPTDRFRSAEIWAGVLDWELQKTKPKLVVIMGRQTEKLADHLVSHRLIRLPKVQEITSYAYIGQRAEGRLGPMHPLRIQAYDQEFAKVRKMINSLS